MAAIQRVELYTERWLLSIEEWLRDKARSIPLFCVFIAGVIDYTVCMVAIFSCMVIEVIFRTQVDSSSFEPIFFHQIDRWLGKPRLKGSFDESNRD